MKVSLLLGAMAIVPSAVNAYPWMAERAGGDGGMDSLKQYLQGMKFDNNQLSNLTSQIKAAQAKVGDVGAPTARMTGPWNKYTKDSIYKTFGLERKASSKRGAGGSVWGVAEDEAHPYIPYDPKNPDHATWQRGPCPGLNTAANHGYLPRDGIVTPVDLFVGLWEALSLAPDLCGLLTFAGFVWKGDLAQMKMSIGGNKDVHGNVVINGPGLSQHGVLEGDSSITREDSAIGDQVHISMSRYNRFKGYCAAQSEFDVTIKSLSQARKAAFDDCVKYNPKCDMNMLRMVVAYAESGFGHEALRGEATVFTEEMLEYWFIHERFPPGWSRRAVPVTSFEMGAWGLAVWAAAPVSPGLSLGGIYVGVPSITSVLAMGKVLGSGNTMGLVQTAVCSVMGAVTGFIPSQLTDGLSGLGVPGMSAMASC